MTGLTIRDYVASDLDAVLRLNREAWPDPAAPEARGAIDAPDLLQIESVYQADGAFLVCVVEGEIAGMIGLQRLDVSTLELRRTRVELSQQGRGIGRALVNAVDERARAMGATQIVLETTVQQTAARRLYEAAGYEFTHASVLENAHGRFDVTHYAKRL